MSKKSYVDDVTYNYSYNSNNQLIEEIVNGDSSINKKYGYDKRGNLTSVMINGILSNEFTYNANNQLLEASLTNEDGKTSATYTYNGIGQRVSQLVNAPTDPEQKINYVLDITKQYNNMLTESEGEVVANYYYDNGAIALDKADEMLYYIQDDLGSILGLTNSDCSFVEEHDYDEFGNELEEVINPIQSLTYTGYRKELATKSLYAQARQYNPAHGRFMSEDILKGDRMVPSSQNSYIYCLNMPNNMIDVDGRKHVDAATVMSPNKGEYAKYGIERNTENSFFADDFDVNSAWDDATFNAVMDDDNIERAYKIKMDYDKTPEFKIVENNGTKYAYVYDSAYYNGGRGGAT